MPRKYFRSTKKTYSKHWAKHIAIAPLNSVNFNTQTFTLCANSSLLSSPTPSLIKCGNFTYRAEVQMTDTSAGSDTWAFCYISYVPEGINLPNNQELGAWFEKHPEYVMAWKPIPIRQLNDQATNDVITVSSRMKRNLNSGDKIIVALYTNTPFNLKLEVLV